MALLAMWHFIKTLGHVVAEGSDLPSPSMPTCSHLSSCDGSQLELPSPSISQATWKCTAFGCVE